MKKNKNIALLGILFSTLFTSCLKENENYSIGTSNPETSIYNIRDLYKGTDVTLDTKALNEAKFFKGVIISNRTENNIPENYIVIQNTWRNQTRGLLIDVSAIDIVSSYNFGDSVIVNLNNAILSAQDDLLVLKGLKKENLNTISIGNTVESRSVSIENLINKFTTYESTYINVTSDLETEPIIGTPLKGKKILFDGDNKLTLFTSEKANFANEPVAPSATFIGVAFKQDKEIQLRLQSYADMAYPSGRIYSGWPETFESPSIPKGSYNMPAINNNVDFHTGQWQLFQSIIGDTPGRDRIVSGKYAIRFQQNLTVDAYLQMNFDLPDGASKITLWYGSYYTDRSCSFNIEYSQDQGASWKQLGTTITDAHTTTQSMTAKQAIILMNIPGPVRFRITKLGLGTSTNLISNGRLGMDDISIFRSY